jgi:Xaa-Pro aminopeptidase
MMDRHSAATRRKRQVKKHRLIEMEWPEFGTGSRPPSATVEELSARLDAARGAMGRAGLTHLVVYGDREHFANLAYLTGFDPRFEEALLIVAPDRTPLLVVGNECEDYVPISPLYGASRLRRERFQSFSLLNQPRGKSRLMRDILGGEGVSRVARVGCVGWKYFADTEHPDGAHALDLPSYLADTLRALAGHDAVVNATAIFMHPRDGLRARCSATEIAYFEYTNGLASEGMKRMLFALREGMTDDAAVRASVIEGEPQGCHITFSTGARRHIGMASPSGQILRRGEPLSSNLCYWGANCCRAGWIASGAQDLPEAARDYVDAFAGPYFSAMVEWFRLLRIGTPGGDLDRLIRERLPFDRFGIAINAGHLIHLDEWLSSPVYPGSTDPIQSGMVIQSDVIPGSAVYASSRMEDGFAVADQTLRAELSQRFPDLMARCRVRRTFMRERLGFELADEILPLSNITGLVPPFLLEPRCVLAG